MAILTDVKARSIKPGDKPISDGNVKGLWLLPSKKKDTKKGEGKWILRFVSPETGKRRDMGLGTYPETKIDDAREAGRQARSLITKGKDPIEEKDRVRLAQPKAKETVTFEQAARKKYAEKLASWSSGKHQTQWITSLEQHVFPIIGRKDVATLKAADFAEALRPIWLEIAETASRIRQRCSDTMKWCQAHELVDGNPLDHIEDILGKQPSKSDRSQHQPAMPWKKIPDFIKGVLRTGNDVSRLGLEFLILTAARSGEVRKAQWDEMDLENGIWTVPASRMKSKKPHRVPLARQAIVILEHQKKKARHPTLVFPSPRRKILTDMAFTEFLRKHKIMSTDPQRIATAHGFRSSFRDWASENRYSRDLAEKALAHQLRDKTEAAYHRTDLLEERRPMMEAWADFVCGGATVKN